MDDQHGKLSKGTTNLKCFCHDLSCKFADVCRESLPGALKDKREYVNSLQWTSVNPKP